MKRLRVEWCALCLLLLFACRAGAHVPDFARTYVDLDYGGNGKPGWVRAGDIDGDGDLDLVAGGGFALFVYENDAEATGWTRYGNLDPGQAIGANGGVLFDVDGDTDVDVVSARYNAELGWWENPGGTLTSTPWTFHVLSQESRYLHDLILVDIDGDPQTREIVANLNQGYWNAAITLRWYRPGADPEAAWEAHTIEANRNEGPSHGHAGLDVADVDGDGHVDLAYANGWYEAPDEALGSWTWHEVTQHYGISNTLIRDIDRNGDPDLLVAAGHHGEGLLWLQAPPDPVTGAWTTRMIDPDLHHPECLQTVDVAHDGDHDVVTCDLFFGEAAGEPGWDEQVHNIYIYENVAAGSAWAKTNIAPASFPSHQLQVVDVDQDGAFDIISESAGHSVISFYRNLDPVPVFSDGFESGDTSKWGAENR